MPHLDTSRIAKKNGADAVSFHHSIHILSSTASIFMIYSLVSGRCLHGTPRDIAVG